MSEAFCVACGGGPWPPHRFYRAGKRKDGTERRDKKCKDCRKEANANHRQDNLEYYRQYDQARYQQPAIKQKRTLQHQRYVTTKRGKAARRRKTRAWRVTHPELYDAQKKRSAAALRAKRQSSITTRTSHETRTE